MDEKRKNSLMVAMSLLDFKYDKGKSNKQRVVFHSPDQRLVVDNWEMLEAWLKSKYYNSRVTAARIEYILYPEHFERVVCEGFDYFKE